MRNLYANFVKNLDICKNFSKNLVDERGNMPRLGVVPRFSDLEVITLSLTAEKFIRAVATIATALIFLPVYVLYWMVTVLLSSVVSAGSQVCFFVYYRQILFSAC